MLLVRLMVLSPAILFRHVTKLAVSLALQAQAPGAQASKQASASGRKDGNGRAAGKELPRCVEMHCWYLTAKAIFPAPCRGTDCMVRHAVSGCLARADFALKPAPERTTDPSKRGSKPDLYESMLGA